MKNFAITGVGGYIAPRHLQAIKDTGNQLIAAVDPNDSVGILDHYSTDISFFTEFERFDRHIEKLRRGPEDGRVDYVSICSPNHLHDAHCRQALRVGADAICEKPLVTNPWNLDALQEIEQETGGKINTVLQLRVHPKLVELRERYLKAPTDRKHDVVLSYITSRGKWYFYSWKGDIDKSGGIATNIGVHFFDLLIWMFGSVQEYRVHHVDPKCMSGWIELERARVRWYLSLDINDLPFTPEPGVRTTYRSITIDGEEVEFTDGFRDLHTRIYEEALAGRGFGIDDVRPSIELVHNIRTTSISPRDDMIHDFLK
jgi:UDP-N-acetyl-2-amino-2-deoxyglucuronate dehydrogenase